MRNLQDFFYIFNTFCDIFKINKSEILNKKDLNEFNLLLNEYKKIFNKFLSLIRHWSYK